MEEEQEAESPQEGEGRRIFEEELDGLEINLASKWARGPLFGHDASAEDDEEVAAASAAAAVSEAVTAATEASAEERVISGPNCTYRSDPYSEGMADGGSSGMGSRWLTILVKGTCFLSK